MEFISAIGEEVGGGVLVVSAEEFVDLIGSAMPCCTLEARAIQHKGPLAECVSGADATARLRRMGHFERPESALLPDRFAAREIVFAQGGVSS